MKKNYFLLTFILLTSCVFGQDIIYKMDKTQIKSKVIEITTDEIIKYKDFDNPDGPIYNLKPENVYMIKYKNGSEWQPTGKTKTSENIVDSNVVKNNESPKIYFDSDWKVTTDKTYAKYYRTVTFTEGNRGIVNDYFISGQLQMSGSAIINDKSHIENTINDGFFTSYYESGNKKSEINYLNGKRHGKSIFYYENGKKNQEVEYANGEANGFVKAWDDDGYLIFKGSATDGKIDGYGTIYYLYTNNKRFEGKFENGVISGDGVAYYKNGDMMFDGYWKNGKPDSYGCCFDQSGNKRCGNFVNGKGTGDATGCDVVETFVLKFKFY